MTYSKTDELQDYYYIDVGKCLALYNVVVMHSILSNENMLFKAFQIGSIAFFFFASGFVFKEHYTKFSVIQYIAKNIKRLLIPYFVLCEIGIFLYYLFPVWYGQWTLKDIMQSLFMKAEPITIGHIWFLFCLFELK